MSLLEGKFVRAPSCEAVRIGVSKQYQQMWNFSNCIGTPEALIPLCYYYLQGAIEGKRIVNQAPINAGSSLFVFTTKELALTACDAHYRFILIDGDGGSTPSSAWLLRN